MIGEIRMENNTLKVRKKRSELKAKAKEIVFLSYHRDMLVDCIIEEQEDDIDFSFNVEGLKHCREIGSLGNEKYRFLANCAGLLLLYGELNFTLQPDNLMFDLNLNPAVLMRDKQEGKTEADFLHMYKSLCGAIINPKYSYSDYEKGGTDLFGKTAELKEITVIDTIEKLRNYLIQKYESLSEVERAEKSFVSKKRYSVLKIMLPILSVLVLVIGAFALYAYIRIIPYQDTLIKADDAYYAGNYVEVQDKLENITVDQLPLSQKYILSRSYVSSESMTQQQKTTVLNGITMNTDEAVMEYWIYLGRLEFDGAIDQAQKIDDNELLLYAYIKQLTTVKDNTTISGEEKSAKVKELEEKISAMTDEFAAEPTTNGEK